MPFKTTLILWTDYDTTNSPLSEIGYNAENEEHTCVEYFLCEKINPNDCPTHIYNEMYPTEDE